MAQQTRSDSRTLAAVIAEAKHAIVIELPEDEPDTIPDWCYEAIVNVALKSRPVDTSLTQALTALREELLEEATEECVDRDPGWVGADAAKRDCAERIDTLLTASSQQEKERPR